MSGARDLLLELGTEELPARHLETLGAALADALDAALEGAGLERGVHHWYATPRRLAVLVRDLAENRPGLEKTRRGPTLETAFDAGGQPTRAALGFARSCGVPVEALEHHDGRLRHRAREPDRPTAELLPGLVREALKALPPMRRMRWNDDDTGFVRPVRRLVLLHGDQPVALELFGLHAGRHSCGHPLLAPAALELRHASEYPERLEKEGKVLADPAVRRAELSRRLEQAAAGAGLQLQAPPELLAEVNALIEWPRVVAGSFPQRFLKLPEELLVTVLQTQQRCFPLRTADGRLAARFLAVMDQDPEDPELVRAGYERVLLPRFEDAAFFRKRDLQRPFAEQRPRLAGITFHHRLGSMLDKSDRIAELSARLATALDLNPRAARRAGELCKCDLVSLLVGEFPDLQGIAGCHYAAAAGEDAAVAQALGEQYLPRRAQDTLPRTGLGAVLALADRLDTLAGIFGAGEAPRGDKDPYGLRRAALGCMRILIEGGLPLDLEQALHWAAAGYGADHSTPGLADFMLERWRSRCLERGLQPELFAAVRAVRPRRPLDLQRRLEALASFQHRAEFRVLAEADKRIRNILRKAGGAPAEPPVLELLREAEELELERCCRELRARLAPHLEQGEYEAALEALAGLHRPVAEFFDRVLVQCEEEQLRRNRLALLAGLRQLLRSVADLSLLPAPGGTPTP